jgi:acetyltransferase-like isoleucine patch superfamily enzyme
VVLAVRTVRLEKTGVDELYDTWISKISDGLDDHSTDRNDFVTGLLQEIYGWKPSDVSTGRVLGCQFDPRNVTLEAEYYGEMDVDRYYRVKPLIWLWKMFDRSPLGANVDLGFRFRGMLAGKVFANCGEEVKIFPDVELSFGYNIECGNHVVIHRGVILDDRGGITIGDGASLSEFVSVYSHSHDPYDIRDVSLHRTEIGAGARITYHATVLAGASVGKDALIGCHGVATRTVRDHHIAVGIPAKSIRIKQRGEAAAPN